MSRIEKALEEAVRLRQPIRVRDAADASIPDERGGAEQGTFIPRSPYLVTLNDPRSAVSEEYRKLKSMIIRATKKDAFRNTLMVTSSLSGEGKSITSLNLAVILAQEYNNTVLLIDADLRRPSLHRYLGITPNVGLSDCLAGGLDAGEAMVKTGIPKLSFLASGTAVDDPVELLSSHTMKALLGEMKQRYRDRYIIIDTPPILPYAETHALSAMVDGIVFVVKEGMASIKGIRDAIDMLNDTAVLGIVYNDVSRETLNNRYHYYYTYSQGTQEKGA